MSTFESGAKPKNGYIEKNYLTSAYRLALPVGKLYSELKKKVRYMGFEIRVDRVRSNTPYKVAKMAQSQTIDRGRKEKQVDSYSNRYSTIITV